MRINKLELKNFRGFEELTIEFPEGESGLAVFIGVNGSGKSSVLESLAFMMQSFVNDMFSIIHNNPINFSTKDIKIKNPQAIIKVEATSFHIPRHVDWEKFNWTYNLDFSGESTFSKFKESGNYVQNAIGNDTSINLPILAYYQTNRLYEENENDAFFRILASQLEAYHDAFQTTAQNFKNFKQWFIDQTNIENQLKIEKKDFEIKNPQLEVIRKAIESFLSEFPNSNFSKIKIGVSEYSSKQNVKQTILIQKNGEDFSIDQLSEGEKSTILLVADIAYRLAVANPSLGNKLNGNGIILIDEIDLHLHPSWQRAIIPCLTNTFPNIQFILTTHSPQVLSNVPMENVFRLKDFKLLHPKPTYGRDSNSILYDLFEEEKQPEHGKKALEELYELIEKEDKKRAEAKLEQLKNQFGEGDKSLLRAEMYIDLMDEKV